MSRMMSSMPIRNPTCATRAPTANTQLKITREACPEPNTLWSMIGAAQTNTSNKLSATTFTPGGDLLCTIARIGFNTGLPH